MPRPSRTKAPPKTIKRCDCDKAQHICRKCSTAIKRDEPGSEHCRQCQSSRLTKFELFYNEAKKMEKEILNRQKEDRKILKDIAKLEEFGNPKANPASTPKFQFSNPPKNSRNPVTSKPNPISTLQHSYHTPRSNFHPSRSQPQNWYYDDPSTNNSYRI